MKEQNTHDTAWKIEITIDMLIDVYHECSNESVNQDGKEDCYDHGLSRCSSSWSKDVPRWTEPFENLSTRGHLEYVNTDGLIKGDG